MNDAVEFLRARLRDDEQAARAAQEDDGYAEWDNPTTGVVQAAGGDLQGLIMASRNAAIHIARHDPARVLREVEAKRQIIDEHSITQATVDGEVGFGCVMCHELDGQVRAGGYCRTLRLLALPYADHPSYREEFKP